MQRAKKQGKIAKDSARNTVIHDVSQVAGTIPYLSLGEACQVTDVSERERSCELHTPIAGQAVAQILNRPEKFHRAVVEWSVGNGRSFPWRETRDPFRILIAEILLKLTGAWKAQHVYNYFAARYETPALMVDANLVELAEACRPLGLHSRANLLIEISRDLNCRFNGSMPKNYAELVSIKGVGQYTANAILCLAYGERVPLVDGSVSRIFRRCFSFHTNKQAYADKDLWSLALELLPERNYREYNLGLLDIGALVCRHRKPYCGECPIAFVCEEAATATYFNSRR